MFDVIVAIVCGGVLGFYLGLVVMACAVDQKYHDDDR